MREFNHTFPTGRDVEQASAEEIGVAIVLHAQANRLDRIAPNNFAGDLNRMYGQQGVSRSFSNAISEGFQWATNALLLIPDLTQPAAWLILSRAGLSFDPGRDLERIQLDRLLPEFLLHPEVKAVSLDIFRIGKYDAAVFEAFKLLEAKIRHAAKFAEGDHGMPMIIRAFHAERGPLTQKRDPAGEREGMQYLMSGAVGVFKNPRSHRNVDTVDAKEAAEMLIIASHLMRIVDARNPV